MAITATQFSLPGQTGFYKGKVRDVYYIDDIMVAVASDRISAFDHILPRPIPFKGQVLNQLAGYFLEATKDIVRIEQILRFAQDDLVATSEKRAGPFAFGSAGRTR